MIPPAQRSVMQIYDFFHLGISSMSFYCLFIPLHIWGTFNYMPNTLHRHADCRCLSHRHPPFWLQYILSHESYHLTYIGHYSHWKIHGGIMKWEKFPALLALCVSEFPSKRPETGSFEVFFDLCLNKHPRRHWFETPLHLLWHHCNVMHQGGPEAVTLYTIKFDRGIMYIVTHVL